MRMGRFRSTLNKRVSQSNVRPMETRLAGCYRKSKSPRNLTMCEPLYVVKKNHIPFFNGQAAKGLPQQKLIGGRWPSRVSPPQAFVRQILYHELIAALLFSCVQ